MRSNKQIRQLKPGAWVCDVQVYVTVNGTTVRRSKTIPAPEGRNHGEAQADQTWHVFHQEVTKRLQRRELALHRFTLGRAFAGRCSTTGP